MTLDLHVDGTFGTLVRPLGDGETMTVEPLAALPPRQFEICPLCRAAPPTTEEDLPPKSLGGSVMTRTCQRCNSGLGTRLERDLSHWFHNVLPDARFTSPGIEGARRAGEVVVMTTAANTATLVMKGGHHPDVDNWLETGREMFLEWRPPDTNVVYLALLKQFYLAVCIGFGIPIGPFGNQAREHLIAARDTPSRNEIPISLLALALPVGKGQPIAGAPAVAEGVEHRPEGDRRGAILAGSIFIPWIFTPDALAPISDRQARLPIQTLQGCRPARSRTSSSARGALRTRRNSRSQRGGPLLAQVIAVQRPTAAFIASSDGVDQLVAVDDAGQEQQSGGDEARGRGGWSASHLGRVSRMMSSSLPVLQDRGQQLGFEPALPP
jgi:hypothetical protein